MLPPPAEMVREEAIQEQKQVSDLASKAIADIEAAYSASVAAYPSIQELEASLIGGLDVFDRRPLRSQAGDGDATEMTELVTPAEASVRVARLPGGNRSRS